MSSKKRISSESSTDEQPIEGSDSAFQQEEDNAKRAKLTSPALSDTTLQDLPIELIECILVKAVAMEVKELKLAKSVWTEKADLVTSRLTSVCSQWDSILTTISFRTKLHRILDGTAQETSLEILHQYPLQLNVWKISTLKDEIFLLCRAPQLGDNFFLNVYNPNNIAEVKDAIQLPECLPKSMTACSVSNCIYILNRKLNSRISVLRVTRDGEHPSAVSTLIGEKCLPKSTLCVTANGRLILSRQKQSKLRAAISVYDADGSMQHEIWLSSDLSFFRDIIPKSNGNLVLVSEDYDSQLNLTEIDMDGIMIRQYQSTLDQFGCFRHADNYGRILIFDFEANGMELLDSEFNLMNCTGLQLGGGLFLFELHYNSERNELIGIAYDHNFQNLAFIVFQLKEI